LEQPSYSEDPAPLLVVLAGLASAAEVAQDGAPELARSRAWAALDAALARDHLSRPYRIVRLKVLNALVAQTRYRLAWRERMRLARTSVFGIGRRLTRALDLRLQDLGLTESAGDLHYLDITEVRGVLNGTLPTTNLAAIARERRSRFAAFASSPAPPDRFETIGPAGPAPTRHAAPAPQDVMRGTAVYGGVVRARCRVILDPRLDPPGSGEIIVARSTDPGWVPLMLGAAGLLVEHGSLLSHSAIVARELGLPTIVGLAGATSALSSGELIEMDGSSGYVRRVGSVA
jgi:pyruvate,water dikinase